MKITITVALVALLLATVAIAGPYSNQTQLGFKDYLIGGRSGSGLLLDPSRLTINHQVSMGFSSAGRSSLLQSMYATNMAYKLSNPLTLSLLMGVQNSRISGYGMEGGFSSLVGGAALDYRPSENLFMRLEFVRGPGYYGPADRFGSRRDWPFDYGAGSDFLRTGR
ncbi:MAG: hypothetical protein FJY67_04275 [Calditrichaeota bacterium]|nr:hypothetical protein [Calditrichota bacterium]